MKKSERFIRHRFRLFSTWPAYYLIALTCLAVGLMMPVLAMVPGGALPAGVAVLLFGIGLLARDGPLLGVAFGFTGGCVALLVLFASEARKFFG